MVTLIGRRLQDLPVGGVAGRLRPCFNLLVSPLAGVGRPIGGASCRYDLVMACRRCGVRATSKLLTE